MLSLACRPPAADTPPLPNVFILPFCHNIALPFAYVTLDLHYLENESPATWPAGLAQVAHVDPAYLIWKYIVMNTPPTLRVSRKLLTSVLDCATVTCYCPFP